MGRAVGQVDPSASAGAKEGEVVDAGQEVGPGEGAAQALDRGELGLGVALDGQARASKSGWCSRSQRISGFFEAWHNQHADFMGPAGQRR